MQVVPDAGHSANEVGIAAELVAANERLKDMMKKWTSYKETILKWFQGAFSLLSIRVAF
jgi:hypothetical protein